MKNKIDSLQTDTQTVMPRTAYDNNINSAAHEHSPAFTSNCLDNPTSQNSTTCDPTKKLESFDVLKLQASALEVHDNVNTCDRHISMCLPPAFIFHPVDARRYGAVNNLMKAFHDGGDGCSPVLIGVGAIGGSGGHGGGVGWSRCLGDPPAAAAARLAACYGDRPLQLSPPPPPPPLPPPQADDPFHADWPHW